MMNEELPVFDLWEKTVGEILDRTAKFPKTVRFSFSSRIDNLALEILDAMVQARYSTRSDKPAHLQHADICLSRLIVLLRLAHARGFVGNAGYEHLSRRLTEVGKMLGGWRKSV
jgi:hypothetical protein